MKLLYCAFCEKNFSFWRLGFEYTEMVANADTGVNGHTDIVANVDTGVNEVKDVVTKADSPVSVLAEEVLLMYN